jgi:hypothetical protein
MNHDKKIGPRGPKIYMLCDDKDSPSRRNIRNYDISKAIISESNLSTPQGVSKVTLYGINPVVWLQC